MQCLFQYIERLLKSKSFGKIEIVLQAGKIQRICQKETIKPSQMFAKAITELLKQNGIRTADKIEILFDKNNVACKIYKEKILELKSLPEEL